MDWLDFPPLSALRAFAALAEAGSAVGAGDKLNVSHAAISQQVKALEARMGVALVDRTGRQLALTSDGQLLAEALLEGFGRIARRIEQMTGADAARPVQISITPSFAAFWLMPRLGSFRQANPGIDLMIDPTPKVVDLSPGGMDLAIRFGSGIWPGLEARLLVSTSLVVVGAPDLVRGRRIETPDDLADLPWLQEFDTTEVSDWLTQKGVTRSRAGGVIQVPGNFMLEGLRAGQGVAVTVDEWVRADVEDGRLVELFRDDGDNGYYVVTRPGVPRPQARVLINWLLREAKEAA